MVLIIYHSENDHSDLNSMQGESDISLVEIK